MKKPKLKALTESASRNKKLYTYDGPDERLLETFPIPDLGSYAPGKGATMNVEITVPEFTSLCPLTGQPDFATIRISYTPRDRCVESKSIKLYMMGFRQHGSFHESIVARIGRDLVKLLSPRFLRVVGEFTPRGGIPFHPTFMYTDSTS